MIGYLKLNEEMLGEINFKVIEFKAIYVLQICKGHGRVAEDERVTKKYVL